MAHRAATDEICVAGVWGTPHQAKGGDSSESPPGVFWLQKTLLATFVGNLTLLGESVVPCLHAEAKTSKGNELLQGLLHKDRDKDERALEKADALHSNKINLPILPWYQFPFLALSKKQRTPLCPNLLLFLNVQ